MTDAIFALLSMFAFGLACGMMLRDWQSKRRDEHLRQYRLRAEWNRVVDNCSVPTRPRRS
jgi:hypothetical protein